MANYIQMRKIAIPLVNNMLCNHFGHSKQFVFIDTDNNKIVKEEFVTPPPHEPGSIPKWLHDVGVTDVIAGGIGQKAIQILLENKINVYVGVASKPSKELVTELLDGSIIAGVNLCDH